MKVAVIGSRGLTVINDLGKYLPEGTTEIVSGGARGIDTCAREYANAHGLKLTEFLPEYDLYGRAAEAERHDHRIRGHGAGVLGRRKPRNGVCDPQVQRNGKTLPCSEADREIKPQTALILEPRWYARRSCVICVFYIVHNTPG